ncbi:MAG: hypothetical protein ABJO65_00320 [Hyphomicrobiales bacterium]
MTASPDNARRAMESLERAIADEAPHKQLAILADSVAKCVLSLRRQVEFHESLQSPMRGILVGDQHISGTSMVALTLPGAAHSVLGRPAAIDQLETLLATHAGRRPLFPNGKTYCNGDPHD